ncbi:MAG: hypothetical protein U5L09_11180 [Bacteroidales bacterium]|nr:hypothetical protein [Bacteroidales bacterium]
MTTQCVLTLSIVINLKYMKKIITLCMLLPLMQGYAQNSMSASGDKERIAVGVMEPDDGRRDARRNVQGAGATVYRKLPALTGWPVEGESSGF